MENTYKEHHGLISEQVDNVNINVLPHALELEKCVLGALMCDTTAPHVSMGMISEELFYSSTHRFIYGAIRALYDNLQAIDMLTVVEELRRQGNLDQAGGEEYVAQLASEVVSAAHIEAHIFILKQKCVRRKLICAAREIMQSAYSDDCDPVGFLDVTHKKMLDIENMIVVNQTIPLSQALDEAMESIKYGDSGQHILSGFDELDRMTGGFRPGTLTILASRPAMGKTALAVGMARNMAVDSKFPVAFFSIEASRRQLVLRLLSQETEIPFREIYEVESLSVEQRRMLVRKAGELRNAPLYIDDTAMIDIGEIRDRCRKMYMSHGIRAVFVDYLQLIEVNNQERTRELGAVVRQLKEMAKELNVPVIALAQFNRSVECRPMGIPQLSDLRESGAIEEVADVVIALHRLRYYGVEQDDDGNSTENQATLRILKHHNGDVGVVNLHFDRHFAKFYNCLGARDSKSVPPMTNSSESEYLF